MIRGRRLTNKESRLMLEAEHNRAMDRVLSCLSKLKPFTTQVSHENKEDAIDNNEYDYIIGKDGRRAGRIFRAKTYTMDVDTGELFKKG